MNKKKLISLTIGLAILIASSVIISLFILNSGSKNRPVEKIRIACVGDSITETSGYPDDLWMLLGSNYIIGNFGVGGSTVALDSSKPYMNEITFVEAKDFQPSVVIIMLGTNDAVPATQKNEIFVNDYVKLITEFQTLSSKPKIWIVKPPPVFSNETGLSVENFKNNIIPSIEHVAEKANLSIINVYSALVNYSELFPIDGVHPNNEGAMLIANEIFKAIS